MNRKEFNVSVSTKENAAKVINGVIQYDTGNLFNISILDGTKPFDFSSYSNVVIEVLKPDGTVFIDGDGGSLDVLDPEEGLVAFTLMPQCVLLKGMHFVSISIYSDGVRVTTARLNYFVAESMDDGQGDDITSMSEYPILQLLLAQNSNIIEAEQMRIIAEQLRQTAEENRESDTSGVLQQAMDAINTAQSYADKVKDWYDLFMSAASEIGGVDLSTVVTKTELREALKDYDCGEFDSAEKRKMQILRGEAENLPALDDGQMAYTRNGRLHIGSLGENVELNKPCFAVQATEPEDTTILWIDTTAENAIKFWDGIRWISASTATFA